MSKKLERIIKKNLARCREKYDVWKDEPQAAVTRCTMSRIQLLEEILNRDEFRRLLRFN